MLYRPWQIIQPNEQKLSALCSELGLPRIVCGVLCARGIEGENARCFINGGADISSELLLANIQKAKERILIAVDKMQRIAIFGDYDADGVTATALLYTYLDGLGADVYYKLPSREDDGYGLSEKTVQELFEKGVKLIITVDNGVCASDAVKKANELGVDVVITDHHLPPQSLPDAAAIVNPHLVQDESPFKSLSGVGVAFKLAVALEGCEATELMPFYADLVAIGTVADLMELTSENREFVRAGLTMLQNPERVGITALLACCGLDGKEITAETISFGIAPRLNAAGRMDSANIALELLLSDDEDEAKALAKELCEKNEQRQKAEHEIAEEIIARIIQNPQHSDDKIIVIEGSNFHQGVIGIVASRIAERFAKPAIIISIDEAGEGKGSGRSVEGISLYDALASCSELLLRYGGHSMAAGMSVEKDNIPAFRKKINEYVKTLNIPLYKTPLVIDCAACLSELATNDVSALSMLAPFGNGNPTPLFCLEKAIIDAIYPVSDGKHSRIRLKQGNSVVYAVMFGVSPASLCYEQGDLVDVALYFSVYEGKSGSMLSGKIKELRPSDLSEEYLEDLYCFDLLCAKNKLSQEQKKRLLPSRAEIAVLYKSILAKPLCTRDLRPFFIKLSLQNAGKIFVGLAALSELGLIEKTQQGGAEVYISVAVTQKKDLSSAKILCALED